MTEAPSEGGTERRQAVVAACFGGGGAFGIGFNLGVAHALIAAGLPIDRSQMLGTSAGSWTAGALVLGAGLDDILATWRHPRPEGKVRVIELTRLLFGEARDARVSVAALRLPEVYPSILSGSRYDLADLVAASSSPLRVTRPHRIGINRYIDAGIVTTTSADRAPRADLLVVVAPMAGPVAGRLGAICARMVQLEIVRWRMAGGQVLLVRPNRAVGALAGTKATDVLEEPRATPAYHGGYEVGARCLERFRVRHPDLFERCAV
jgi:predicted acylesterase/phospholipase RssA